MEFRNNSENFTQAIILFYMKVYTQKVLPTHLDFSHLYLDQTRFDFSCKLSARILLT